MSITCHIDAAYAATIYFRALMVLTTPHGVPSASCGAIAMEFVSSTLDMDGTD